MKQENTISHLQDGATIQEVISQFFDNLQNDPRIQKAIAELQGLIQARYPDALFDVTWGEDPLGFYLNVTVDVEDTDEVVELILDRQLEMQIEEELPVYVFVLRPLARELERLEQERRQSPRRAIVGGYDDPLV